MIFGDLLLSAALLVFVIALWWRKLPARGAVAWLSALLAVVIGSWLFVDDRWQGAVGGAVGVILLVAVLVRRSRSRWLHRRWLRVPAMGVLTLLALLGPLALWMFPVADLPPPTGPYAVGVRDIELVDQSRKGVLHDRADQPRRLLVRVWYPAQVDAGAPGRPYFSSLEADTTARGLGQLIGFPQALTYLKHVRTHAVEGAPLLAGAATLPTVLYSHGYTSFLGQNSALMEELASHGYSVWSIQHTYDASATVFPDGSVAPMDPALTAIPEAAQDDTPVAERADIIALTGKDFDARLQGHLLHRQQALERHDRIATLSASTWLRDRIFVLDRLADGAVPASVAEIAAASDFTRTGQVGMSFGGSATGGFCAIDARCAAGINLDGLNYHPQAFDAEMPVPFLMLHADPATLAGVLGVAPPVQGMAGFNEFSYERFGQAGARADIHRLQVRGAAHMGFSDLSLFARRPLRDAFLGRVPAKTMIALQNDVVRGFMDRYLRCKDQGFPQTQLAAYQDWLLPLDNAPLRAWWRGKPQAERDGIEQRIQALAAQPIGMPEAPARNAATLPQSCAGSQPVQVGAGGRH